MTPLTPQQRLEQVEGVRHKLLTGQLAYLVEVDGRKVQFTRTDLDAIDAEIAALKAEIAGERPRYGAIGFIF
jgi:hypothetical protein